MKKLTGIIVISLLLLLSKLSAAGLPACISNHYPGKTITHQAVLIDAPDIAENGAVVSVGIKGLRNINPQRSVREISFYNEFRREPVARFKLGDNTMISGLKTRLRLRASSNIYAVALLDNGELISGKSFIKVTISGCGGGGMPDTSAPIVRVCK